MDRGYVYSHNGELISDERAVELENQGEKPLIVFWEYLYYLDWDTPNPQQVMELLGELFQTVWWDSYHEYEIRVEGVVRDEVENLGLVTNSTSVKFQREDGRRDSDYGVDFLYYIFHKRYEPYDPDSHNVVAKMKEIGYQPTTESVGESGSI